MRLTPCLLSLAALPLAATELPPAIPSGDISYDSISYDTSYSGDYQTPAVPYTAPVTPVSSDRISYVNLNAYSSNYTVRGMGFTDVFTHHGFSSLSGSWTLPNRNLFGLGIQQRLGGEFGYIWDTEDLFGDTPLVRFDYAIGKEIFPNLLAEIGYSLHHGGAEGFLAHASGDCPHRLAQDFNLRLSYNDRQRGFFGHALWGWGFQGLTGSYFDAELGYRFTNVLNGSFVGSDVEVSAGIAPSLGYWGAGVEGIDAYRIRVALPLYTHGGAIGRDARFYITPWGSCSWSGCNSRKIERAYDSGIVDHFLFTFGVDLGFRF